MPTILTYPDNFLSTARQVFDDLIENNGKPCRLLYPPVSEACPNCLGGPAGQFSSNRYRAGGPVPFSVGACPLCNGTNQRMSEVTEVVTLVLLWNPKDWVPLPGNLRTPEGDLQTKGAIAELPKVLACTEMIADTTLEATIRQKFRLSEQPFDDRNIVKGRYFVATWKKVG